MSCPISPLVEEPQRLVKYRAERFHIPPHHPLRGGSTLYEPNIHLRFAESRQISPRPPVVGKSCKLHPGLRQDFTVTDYLLVVGASHGAGSHHDITRRHRLKDIDTRPDKNRDNPGNR